jgi:hypothetical protein
MASSIDPGSCSTDDRDRIIQTYAGSLGTVCELDHVVVHHITCMLMLPCVVRPISYDTNDFGVSAAAVLVGTFLLFE